MCVITLHPVCSQSAAAEPRREPTISQHAITADSHFRELRRVVISCSNVFFTCLRRTALPDNLCTAITGLLCKYMVWLKHDIIMLINTNII